MRRITTTILFILLFIVHPAIGQSIELRDKIISRYKTSVNETLIEEISILREENYSRALNLAKKHKWPLEYQNKHGGLVQLIGVSDDRYPLYYGSHNRGGVQTIFADRVHSGGDMGLNLNGENMIVGIWDENSVFLTHELFNGRVEKRDSGTELSAHATHVTGTLLGSSFPQAGGAIGVAHKAKAVTYDWNQDINEMIREARDHALIVSNHSYGIQALDENDEPSLPVSYFGSYNQYAVDIDHVLYEYDYYLPVYAAGNDRDDYALINPDKNGYDLLTAETVAKNTLVVASVHEVTDFSDPSAVRISSFSNFGPTDDGRIKPDISAKGHGVFSSSLNTENSYAIFSGTSMAAPSVTGGIALIQQYAIEEYGNALKSATIRGLVAHTASKAGVEGTPNYRYGWGVFNVARAVELLREHEQSTRFVEMSLRNGQSYMTTVMASELEEILATIAWTDPAGRSKTELDERTPNLVNDLDLRLVHQDGTIYYPFSLNPLEPTKGGLKGDNTKDNIEKVEVLDPNGSYNVLVYHKGGIRDKNNRLNKNNTQDFSLLLSGLAKQDFTLETFNNNSLTYCQNSESSKTNEKFKLELKGLDNLAGGVTIDVNNLPNAVNPHIDITKLNSHASFEIEFDGVENLDLGEYAFQVKVTTANGETAVINPYISIVKDDFEAPNLLFPAKDEDNVNTNVNFSWEALDGEGVAYYNFQVSETPDFSNPNLNLDLFNQTSYSAVGLFQDKKYYWRVKAVGNCGEGEWSEIYNFYTYDILSVDSFEVEETLKIYPNPAEDIVHVQAVNTIKKIEMFNILGQSVLISYPNTESTSLDTSKFPSGNYVLKITDDESTKTKKVIVK